MSELLERTARHVYMTYDEVVEATEKFRDYLMANGKRPVVMVLDVCNDHDNTEQIGMWGNPEQLDEAAITTLAYTRGMKLEYL